MEPSAATGSIQHQKPQVPAGYAAQTEGLATILQKGNEVFYNPAQVVNRDLSIAVLTHFSNVRRAELASAPHKSRNRYNNINSRGGVKRGGAGYDGLHILEGLSASGLRAIRYAKEIEGVARVVANDMDPSVVDSIRRNIEFNGPEAVARVVPSQGDARLVMMQNPSAFDAVDLDPYGSPSTLLDTAVQAVADGGLLLVTATDMAVLCGNNSEACFAKYGSYPLHKSYCHEMAVRIVLASISSAAARAKRYIVPVLSCSIDFYVRIFVRVYESAAEVKNTATKLGYVYQSNGCDSYYWQRLGRKMEKANKSVKYGPGLGPAVPQSCPDTGANFSMGGPFWAEPIHDQEWVRGVLALVRSRRERFAAFEKIQGLLTTCAEELPDIPLYFNLHDVCKTLRTTPMRAETFRSALINAGFRVSGSHCTPLGVKTDAPWTAVWDILRCWVADHPVKSQPGSASEKILAKEPGLKADFSRAPSAVQYKSKGKGNKRQARFPANPEANWGPKSRHGKKLRPNQQREQQQHDREEKEAQMQQWMAGGEEMGEGAEVEAPQEAGVCAGGEEAAPVAAAVAEANEAVAQVQSAVVAEQQQQQQQQEEGAAAAPAAAPLQET